MAKTLREAWTSLTDEDKRSICDELRQIVFALRRLKQGSSDRFIGKEALVSSPRSTKSTLPYCYPNLGCRVYQRRIRSGQVSLSSIMRRGRSILSSHLTTGYWLPPPVRDLGQRGILMDHTETPFLILAISISLMGISPWETSSFRTTTGPALGGELLVLSTGNSPGGIPNTGSTAICFMGWNTRMSGETLDEPRVSSNRLRMSGPLSPNTPTGGALEISRAALKGIFRTRHGVMMRPVIPGVFQTKGP